MGCPSVGDARSSTARLNRSQTTSSPSCSLCFSGGELLPRASPRAADNGASDAALHQRHRPTPREVPRAEAVRRCAESRPDRRPVGVVVALSEMPRAANASSGCAPRPCPRAARRTTPTAHAASYFRPRPTKNRVPRPTRAARKPADTRLRDGAAARRETFVARDQGLGWGVGDSGLEK
jgi:hypothetical protein